MSGPKVDVDKLVAYATDRDPIDVRLRALKASVAMAESNLIERRRYRDEAIQEALAAGWSYRRIAEAAGVSIGWITQIARRPSESELRALDGDR